MTKKPNFAKCILGVFVLAILFIGTFAFTHAPRTRATNLAPSVTSNVTVANSTTMVPVPSPTVDVTTAFELEGNIKDDPNFPNDGKEDWERLNCEVPYTGSATAHTGVVADAAPLSIYTGGGSKDTYDINNTSASGTVAASDTSWLFKDGAVPDKDDITNGYAASYVKDGQTLLYVGGERVSNAGDAFIGTWFFQNPVFNASAGLDGIPGNTDDVEFADGTFRSAPSATAPLARHAFGDILVLANFPGGVAASDAKVFEWVQTPGLDGISGNGDDGPCTNDDTAFGGTTVGNCPIAGFNNRGKPITRCASSTLCDITPGVNTIKTAIGFTNGAPLSETAEGVCWPYASKVETSTDEIPVNSFFEVGINLSALGLGGECFPSFALETRSSESVTAQLKDFVLHAFQSCGSSCDKTPHEQTVCEDQLTPGFGTVTQTFSASNTGTVPITVTLKDHQVFPDASTNDSFITGKDGTTGACTFGAETNIPIAAMSTFTCTRTASLPLGTTTDTLTVHTVSPAGIEDCTQTATATVNANPVAAADQPAAVCAALTGATSFSLNGTATNGTPHWTVQSVTGGNLTLLDVSFSNADAEDPTANIAAGKYGRAVVRLTVSNSTTNCPSDFVDINLDVDPNPTVTICSTDGDKACTTDESLTLTATVSPAGGTVHYTWTVPTGVTCGDAATCTASLPGTYRVDVTRAGLTTAGCPGNASIHVGLCALCTNP